MSKTKNIEAVKARQNMGQLMDQVFYKGENFVIERSGKPMVAMIPITQFRQWQKRRDEFFSKVKRVREQTKKVQPMALGTEIKRAVQVAKRKELEDRKNSKN